MALNPCPPLPNSRFRTFWTTQIAACGVRNESNGCTISECAIPGLVVMDVRDLCNSNQLQCYNPCNTDPLIGKTIANTNWITGLILNILYTNQEWPATNCGRKPGNRSGYWADAYRTDKIKTGSRLHQLTLKGKIRDFVALVEAYMRDDLQRLVNPYRVANQVDVKATYVGNNTVEVIITVYGETETARVAVSGTRLENNWVWSA